MIKRGNREHRIQAEGNSLRIMGAFFVVFGLVLWIAILFTDDVRGQVTDFGTGLLLAGIGILMFFKGRKLLSRRSDSD